MGSFGLQRLALFSLSALGLACSGGSESSADSITVFAAASTAEVLSQLDLEFEAAELRLSLGSSGALARQVLDGAPAQIYVSADPRWIAELERAGRLAEPARVLCSNRLVCIAPPGSPLVSRAPGDALELARQLERGDRVALADRGVPAGDYVRQSLEHSGGADRLRPFLVGQPNVRAVLRAVESGQVVAGFVYATDARVAQVDVLFALDPASHQPIRYGAARLKSVGDEAVVRGVFEHLSGPRARAILLAAGFVPAE